MSVWSHGKWDAPIVQMNINTNTRGVNIPITYSNPAVPLLINYVNGLWFTDSGQLLTLDDLHFVDARWVVRNTFEFEFLTSLGLSNVICLEHESESLSQEERPLSVLRNIIGWDVSKHATSMSAWRHADIKKIRLMWPHGREDSEQFCRSIDDRPWAETRMAYQLKPINGTVLDIKGAYASALAHMPFPKLDAPWSELSPGVRQPYALHLIEFRPTSSLARYYLPFVYTSHHRSSLVAYGSNDRVLVWVTDSMIDALERRGCVERYLQSVLPVLTQHPLNASALRWMELRERYPDYASYIKRRANAAHSWTWQPRSHTFTSEQWITKASQWYGLAPKTIPPARAFMSAYLDDGISDVVWKMASPENSGCYLPVFWIRMQLRAAITSVVHALVEKHQANIAMVHIDGVHAWAEGASREMLYETANVALSNNWPYWTMRENFVFERGVWLKPGSYALMHEDKWVRRGIGVTTSMNNMGPWFETLGVLDTRRDHGFWRRPNCIMRWCHAPNVGLNPSRKLRKVLLTENIML